MAIAGDINTGQHHLFKARVDELLNMFDDAARGDGAAVAAAIGYDAKCAAVIAAILYFDKSAGFAGIGGNEMRRGLRDGHDVRDNDWPVGTINQFA